MQGFNLHVAARCGANDGQALEQLRRHITPCCKSPSVWVDLSI
jgi:hypothetical protein